MTRKEQANAILQRISQAHYISLERLLGTGRDRVSFIARQAAAHALADIGLDSVQIGRYLNRHPSTVLNMLGTLAKSKKRKNQDG